MKHFKEHPNFHEFRKQESMSLEEYVRDKKD